MVNSMTPKRDWIKDWLHQRGFRVTSMRMAVIALLEQNPLPLSLLEIHRKLPKGKCDFSTVFRFMEQLEAKGLVERIPWIDGSARHYLRDEHHHRHYLICRECQKVESVEGCGLSQTENRLGSKCGYTEMAHNLLYSGICPICQQTSSPKGAGQRLERRSKETNCHHQGVQHV
jgi:Fur family ferric uptake transcriptional regulator